MFSDKGVYTYRDSGGRKHKVPMVRASSLDQIRPGDHICFPRLAYWHHAIVETVKKSNGEVNVIHYSNTAKQFSQDNSSPPKNPGLAVVVRQNFKLESESVYVIKHDRSFDTETVVSRAKSKLGERKYHPVTNNCEHFALWCKTGISSSEQVWNAMDAVKIGLEDVVDTLNTGLLVAVGSASAVKEEAKTGMSAVTKQVVTGTGQEMAKTGIHVAAKEVAAQSVSNTGRELVESAVRVSTKEVVTGTVSKTRQEVVKTGARTTTKEVVTKVGLTSIAGALSCLVAFEYLFAAHDIVSVYKDKEKGKISQSEFNKAVKKRVVTGTMNVAVSSAGAAIGQVVIPVPVVGGFVGGIVGSVIGKAIGGRAVS